MKNHKFYSLSVLVLCFFLLFSLTTRPMTVDAAVVTTIVIGGITYALSSAEVATIIAILIAGGAAISGELVQIAEDIWAGLKEISKTFIVDGTSARKLVLRPDVREDINNNANKDGKEYKIPVSGAELFLPDNSAWQHAENITDEQILTTGFDVESSLDSIDESIIAGNQISFQILNQLMSFTSVFREAISNTITNAYEAIFNKTAQFRDNFLEQVTNTGRNLEAFRTKCYEQLANVTDYIGNFRETVVSQFGTFLSKLEQTRTNLVSGFNNLLNKLEQIRLNIYNLPNIGTNIYNKLVELVDYFTNFATDDEKLVEAEKGLANIIDDYQAQLVLIMNNSRDILSKYSNAFLAVGSVLVSFASLPVFSDLIAFSIALGCFALFVNLANMAISSSHSNSAKGKAYKSAKGG